MINIIKIKPNENGGRPAIQQWNSNPPVGFAELLCDFEDTFIKFRGFVNATIEPVVKTISVTQYDEEGNELEPITKEITSKYICTSITGNQEALNKYLEEYPDLEPEQEVDINYLQQQLAQTDEAIIELYELIGGQ